MSRWSYALSPCWNSENLLFLGDSKEMVYPRARHTIMGQFNSFLQIIQKTHLEGLPRSSSIGPSLRPPPESLPDGYPSCSKHARPPKSRTGEKKDTTASCKIHNWKRWENKRDKRVFWSACMNGRRVWTDGAPMPRPPALVVTFQLRLHLLPSSVSVANHLPCFHSPTLARTGKGKSRKSKHLVASDSLRFN